MIFTHQNSDIVFQTILVHCVSKRKKLFKEDERGRETMCELVENYAKKREKESALRLFQNGASYELVRTSITSLTDEELQEIYQNATKS